MQQGSPALKRAWWTRRSGAALGLGAVSLVGVALSGCAAAWSGGWQGTVDLGPVDAHAMTLTLTDGERPGELGSAKLAFAATTLQVCKRSISGTQITIELDTGRPDCSLGEDAKRLRLVGRLGANVIHGDVFRDAQRVGFFRAFRKNAEKSVFQRPMPQSQPTPDEPKDAPQDAPK